MGLPKLFRQYREQYQKMVGLGGLEPPTSRLSGVRSNQLSYRPDTGIFLLMLKEKCRQRIDVNCGSAVTRNCQEPNFFNLAKTVPLKGPS